MMERVCFTLHVKLDRLDEYVEDHKNVWSEVLEALTRSGWHNYSLFLNRKDGCLITYCEVDDFQKAMDAIAQEEASLRWQARWSITLFQLLGRNRQMLLSALLKFSTCSSSAKAL